MRANNATDSAVPDGDRFSKVTGLDELYRELETVKMGPGWNKPEPSMYPKPKKTYVPVHWSYGDARPALHAAGDLVDTKLAERRNLILANPIPGNTYNTTSTLVAAYQMVRGRETARSHRHTPNALRMVLETGPETYTVVQGQKYLMSPGDVLLTPNWLWHGHSNEGDTDAYWIDFLDVPLVEQLGPMFFEHYPEHIEQTSKVAGASDMHYRWQDTRARLDSTPAQGGTRLIELGRANGEPAMDTIALYVRQIDDGATTEPEQTTSNEIVAVMAGQGESDVDGTCFSWSRGDVFAVPAWRPHRHTARGGEAVLLRVTDRPVMKMLNWLRTAD